MSKALLRAYCACVVLFGFCSVNAWAADNSQAVKQCAQEKVTFDGIQPLKYADVTSEPDSHIPLWHQHPALCSSVDEAQCKGKAYLIPGNTVAVANTCGDYAHVQYIGEKTVSYGWIVENALQYQQHKMDDSASARQEPPEYQFKLTNGNGIPVCEAYLQRLNQSIYPEPKENNSAPYCGRPEDDTVPGFTKLNRIALSPEEVNRLYNKVYDFRFPPISHRDVDVVEAYRAGKINVTEFVKPGLISVWRYNPLVDLFNNGKPKNIMLWQGLLPDKNDEYDFNQIPYCRNTKFQDWGFRLEQLIVVFDRDGSDIDTVSTKQLIAHPFQEYDTGIKARNWISMTRGRFRPIGTSLGIFEYRSIYYMDTFFDIWGDAQNNSRGDPSTANILGVLLHRNGVTKQVCEYRMSPDDYPVPLEYSKHWSNLP